MMQARENNPSVVAQQAAKDAAEQELRKNRAEHLPTLDFTASYGSSYASGTLASPADIATRSRSGQVGLQLSVPLFLGGGTQARVKEAAANLNRSRADVEAVRRQAAAEARQAFAGVSNGLAQVQALVSAVESSKSSVEANQVGYRTGTRINIDVLNAEQQLYAAVRDLAKARYDTIMQSLRLRAAAGNLAETDLQGVNALLETPTPVALSAAGSVSSRSQ
jgi:outer membrane protein